MIFISAVPIFSSWPNHKHTKKSIIEGIKYGTNFSEKCVSVSSAVSVDVDFEKLESLYEVYNECATGVGDYEQFGHDLMEVMTNVWKVRTGSTLYLSDNHKTDMAVFLQKLVSIIIIVQLSR